jgi:hypothetical protein
LDVHNFIDVRQIEVHTSEPLVRGPTPFQTEHASAKLGKLKSPDSDLNPAEVIQAEGDGLVLQSYSFYLK